MTRAPTPSHCAGCGAPDALPLPQGDPSCPRCHREQRRYDDAKTHLRSLLEPVLMAWQSHWEQQGLSRKEAREIAGLGDIEDLLEP